MLQINRKTIHEELVRALGPNAALYTTVTKWAKRFLEGKKDVNDGLRCSSPLSQFTGKNTQLIRQVISNDLRSTYDEVIAETSLALMAQ